MKLVLTGPEALERSKPDPTLMKAIARGHVWFEQLARGEARSIKSIARREGVADRYVSRLINLAFLAPDIVEAILDGRQPPDLSLDRLTLRTGLPLDWSAQRTCLGL